MVEPSLLEDGVIDRQSYEHAKVKIVHLLKQGVAEQNPKGYTSLVKMIRDDHTNHPDSLPPMWMVCAQRSYCILHGFPPWTIVKALRVQDELWPAFWSGAVVNLVKKTGPVNITDDHLNEGLSEYGNLVREQIEHLNPHVIVCGGTFDVWLKRIHRGNYREGVCPSGMRFVCLDGVFYLDAYHPSHRAKQAMEYSWFRACAAEILGSMVQSGVGQVTCAPDE